MLSPKSVVRFDRQPSRVIVEFKLSVSISPSACRSFMTILSQVPDTLISRKYGNEIAEAVSRKAEGILKFKDDDSFVEKLLEFDDYLYENKYNPGTTADLTAASIFLSYLAKEF